MGPVKPELLVVLVAGIGDLILATMGLRAIRNGHPSTCLHLLTSVEAAPIARHFSFVDKVWPFPLRQIRGDKRSYAGAIDRILSLRSHRFEKIVNLYQVASPKGALAMGLMFSLLRSPCKIGHDRHGFGIFLDQKIPGGFFQGRHMADSLLEMAVRAGGRPDNRGIEVFRPGDLSPRLKRKLDFGQGESSLKLIAIHPGADAAGKRAHPAIFSSTVNRLNSTMGVRTVIFGGPGEEEIAGRIARDIQGPVVDLTGETSLEELVGVMGQIDLLIANDSGPMHFAAALKKPLVAVFAGGSPEVFGPYGDPGRFRIIEIDRSAISRCDRSIAGISEQIAAMGRELLSG